MPLARALMSWKLPQSLPEDTFTNTLYFNVSGSVDDPDYDSLAQDLATLYAAQTFTDGMPVTCRMYDMADAKPRPIKGEATVANTGSIATAAPQVALCLSYYADRNLPSSRGRIYTGPWYQPGSRPSGTQQQSLITLANGLWGIGGLNVDWSLYSPKTGQATRINNVWVDDSWDIIRGRKLKPTSRVTATGNG